jgi:hypothetical protein
MTIPAVISVDMAVRNPTREVCTPQPQRSDEYSRLYGLYRDLYPATRPIAHDLARRQRAGRPRDDGLVPADEAPAEPTDIGPPGSQDDQALRLQSREDTVAGWGELPEPDEHERFYRDRPPHWDSE